MIGSHLTRFGSNRFAVFDMETTDLNLYAALPWELSYGIASLKNGIEEIHTSYILWPGLQLSDDAARVTRFDKAAYLAKARPPAEVWAEFSPILYDPSVIKVGHNIFGLDYAMISTWRRAMGLRVDHSWQDNALDTNALSKAYIKGWAPDISSLEARLAWQYRCLSVVEKGFKSNLGFMAGQLGIPFNENELHGAEADIRLNWNVFRELVFKMEI